MHVKNHYVPKCYLKNWQNPNGKVYMYRLLVSHPNVPIWRQHSVAEIAYQERLYTQIVAGCEVDEVERWFDQKFERPAIEALEKVTYESRLCPDDWGKLIDFLAAQDVRTPARMFEHLQRAQKTLPQILEDTGNRLQKHKNLPNSLFLRHQGNNYNSRYFPIKVTSQLIENSANRVLMLEAYVGRSSWLYSIKHLLENTKQILHSHKWSIIKPAEGYYWPTSDNPVVKINYHNRNNYDLKGGWGVRKGNIFFPIDPEHAMFVQIGDQPPERNVRLNKAQTEELIRISVENAHRNIFSVVEDHNLPTLRKRIVSSEQFEKEKNEMSEWLKQNRIIEEQYFASSQRK